MEPPDHPLIGKTAQALLVMACALAVPYASSALRPLRVVAAPWDRAAHEAQESDGPRFDRHPPQAATLPPPTPGEQALPASENLSTINNALPAERQQALPDIDSAVRESLRREPIEDPTGHALDGLFERLARSD